MKQNMYASKNATEHERRANTEERGRRECQEDEQKKTWELNY